MRRERGDLASYSQLIQDLINGSVRRHTFTQSELELLFDVQTCRLRKSSKPEALRRYLRAVNQHLLTESGFLRFSTFLDREMANRLAATSSLPMPLPQSAA
jgi:hypothetical protein